ncbi:Ankyrin repeat domain-containing protein 50 [Fusarium oxysporum f. sp. raphani]|uniref:Ankyrin repeat domain-containing protein 50 n=1 Tax=Fusarium oxysporum f. sp. raphani TaxID=96318 RepID=A0A8J5PGT6_FUSOX|nr:Ankyrin repeat domain-containing protein 50 [Fusarium oxysporum f. sp. raphani]
MSNPHNYIVGWICALRTEYVAAQMFLDERHEPPEFVSTNDNNNYTLGKIGKHNVAIAVLPHGEYGTSSAASVARDMLHSFPNIRIGLMVGIGGGAPSPKHDIRLGDIVVSASGDGKSGGVFHYDHGKIIQNQPFQETGFLDRPPTILRAATQGLMAQYEAEGHQLEQSINTILDEKPRLRKKYKRPQPTTDRLYQPAVLHKPNDKSSCALCSKDPSSLIRRDERTSDEDNPSIHYGLIASSNKLIKDALIRDAFAKRDVLCFETEAAGLMNHFPCLVIRGICDYADTHKNDEWQGYAAMAAAAYAKDLLYQIHPNRAEVVERINDVLSDLQNEVSATSRRVDTIINHHQTQEHRDVLDWLTTANYSPIQSDNIARRQPGTGQWLLESPQFLNWRESPNQTLFCPGIPGAGKTILTSIIIDSLERLFLDDKNVGIAYVYCNFRRQDEQTARELLSSLLKQLLQSLLTLPESIKLLYKKHKNKGSRPSLEEVLTALLSVTKLFSRVFVLIDALDECCTTNGTMTRFLEGVFNLQSKSEINIFATSRPIPDVTDLFKNSISLEIRATDEDVRRFIHSHMSQLPSLFRRQGLEKEVVSQIVCSVKGMFLLAQLHLDSLRDKTSVDAVHKALEKLPTGSDAYYHAYETAMERIMSQLPGHRDLAKRVLSWITCAKRPLTVKELQHALAVEVGTTELNKNALPGTGIMVQVCVGLVTIDKGDGTIRLVHYTTQEYFEKTQTTWFPKAENEITTTCVTYLNFQVFKSGLCPTDEDFTKRLRMNPLFYYASMNWGHHARNTTSICEGVIDFLQSDSNVESSDQALMAVRDIFGHLEIRGLPRKLKGLHLAAYFGAVAETQTLLRANNPDLQDENMRTALFYAARNGHSAVVKLLLESGAKSNSRDYKWRTPLSLTASYGQKGTMELLLAAGAEADRRDLLLQTPLFYASQSGHEDIVRLLLGQDVNVNSAQALGQTPLSIAAENGHANIVQLLLNNGANANSEDIQRQTPLSLAAKEGHSTIVQLLLENGANANSLDGICHIPLSLVANILDMKVRQRLDKPNPSPSSKTPVVSLYKSTAQQTSIRLSSPGGSSRLKRSYHDDDTLSAAISSKLSRV